MGYKITPVFNKIDTPSPEGDHCVVELKFIDKEFATQEDPELSLRIYRYPNDWSGYYLDFLPGDVETGTTTTTVVPTTTPAPVHTFYKPSNNALIYYWPETSHPYGHDGRLMKKYPDGTDIYEQLEINTIEAAVGGEAKVELTSTVPGSFKAGDTIFIKTANEHYNGFYVIKDMLLESSDQFIIYATTESGDSGGHCVRYPQEYTAIDLSSEITAIREHLERGDIVIFGGWRQSGSDFYYTKPINLELNLPEIVYDSFVAGAIKNQGALATLSQVDVEHIKDEAIRGNKLAGSIYDYIIRSRELIEYAFQKLSLIIEDSNTLIYDIGLATYVSSSGVEPYIGQVYALELNNDGLASGEGTANYEITEAEIAEALGADFEDIISGHIDWSHKIPPNTGYQVWLKYAPGSTPVLYDKPLEQLPKLIDGVALIDTDTIYIQVKLQSYDNITTPYLYAINLTLTVDLST